MLEVTPAGPTDLSRALASPAAERTKMRVGQSLPLTAGDEGRSWWHQDAERPPRAERGDCPEFEGLRHPEQSNAQQRVVSGRGAEERAFDAHRDEAPRIHPCHRWIHVIKGLGRAALAKRPLVESRKLRFDEHHQEDRQERDERHGRGERHKIKWLGPGTWGSGPGSRARPGAKFGPRVPSPKPRARNHRCTATRRATPTSPAMVMSVWIGIRHHEASMLAARTPCVDATIEHMAQLTLHWPANSRSQ